jgi:hypothetical protein
LLRNRWPASDPTDRNVDTRMQAVVERNNVGLVLFQPVFLIWHGRTVGPCREVTLQPGYPQLLATYPFLANGFLSSIPFRTKSHGVCFVCSLFVAVATASGCSWVRFLAQVASKPAPGPTYLPVQCILGTLSRRCKAAGARSSLLNLVPRSRTVELYLNCI